MPPRYMKHVCCIESISKIQSHLVCKADGEIKWMSNILNAVHFNASLRGLLADKKPNEMP